MWLLWYVNITKDMKLVLATDNLRQVKMWIDTLFVVHQDKNSQTGGLMLLGCSNLICRLVKQNLNLKSSTKVEVAVASNYMSNMMWAHNFIAGQGYNLEKNVLAQDNMSTI